MLLMIYYFAFTLVIISTFISFSLPSHPLITWMGLELNSLSFIPLMKNSNNLSSHESMIKYFLIQSITSMLFLMSTLLLHHTILSYPPFLNSILSFIMSLSLLTKLAAAPFHFWMFPLINSISWFSFILLMTWQKLIPLFMMSYLLSNLIIISIVISTLLPPIMMMNQNSIKMILGYATIIHTAWLLMINVVSTMLLSFYILIYIMNFIPIFYLFSYWNTSYLSQIIFIPNIHKIFLFFMTLSLMGFPPSMMFMIKIMLTFQFIQNYSFYLMSMFLLYSSLFSSYIYIYMNFPLLINNSYLLKNSNPQTFFPLQFFILISFLSIPTLYILVI